MPTVDQILEKYVAALGGEAALQKTYNQIAKGTATDAEGRKFPFEVFYKIPTKRVFVIQRTNALNIMYSYDGDTGWMLGEDGPPHIMKSNELDPSKLEDPFYFAGRMKQVFSDLRVDGTEKVDNHDAYVLAGRTGVLPLVKLYFDKDSGLLVRLVSQTETALGRLPVQVDYADYRTSDGVKIPFRWTTTQSRGRLFTTYQFDDVRHPVPNFSEFPE